MPRVKPVYFNSKRQYVDSVGQRWMVPVLRSAVLKGHVDSEPVVVCSNSLICTLSNVISSR